MYTSKRMEKLNHAVESWELAEQDYIEAIERISGRYAGLSDITERDEARSEMIKCQTEITRLRQPLHKVGDLLKPAPGNEKDEPCRVLKIAGHPGCYLYSLRDGSSIREISIEKRFVRQ